MPWTIDRGRHGIVCFVCRGKGRLLGLRLADGARQVVTCPDCSGEGFVKHCVGCQGTGRVDDGTGTMRANMVDCPECSGKGYPLPKRTLIS